MVNSVFSNKGPFFISLRIKPWKIIGKESCWKFTIDNSKIFRIGWKNLLEDLWLCFLGFCDIQLIFLPILYFNNVHMDSFQFCGNCEEISVRTVGDTGWNIITFFRSKLPEKFNFLWFFMEIPFIEVTILTADGDGIWVWSDWNIDNGWDDGFHHDISLLLVLIYHIKECVLELGDFGLTINDYEILA